jgi:Fur family transcriptional regulator, ferric uptake regulator
MTVTTLTRAFQAQGLKLTHSRLAVWRVLTNTTEHLKVAEVHRRARRIDSSIGLASVYRTMDLLERLQLVKHVHLDHRHRHYATATDGHCHHLACRTCGVVVEFSDCQADAMVRVLARRTKFRIEGHCMDFVGQCPACLRRSARTSRSSVRAPHTYRALSPAPRRAPRSTRENT